MLWLYFIKFLNSSKFLNSTYDNSNLEISQTHADEYEKIVSNTNIIILNDYDKTNDPSVKKRKISENITIEKKDFKIAKTDIQLNSEPDEISKDTITCTSNNTINTFESKIDLNEELNLYKEKDSLDYWKNEQAGFDETSTNTKQQLIENALLKITECSKNIEDNMEKLNLSNDFIGLFFILKEDLRNILKGYDYITNNFKPKIGFDTKIKEPKDINDELRDFLDTISKIINRSSSKVFTLIIIFPVKSIQ